MDPTTTFIANILHRETIAAIVGARTFERGERCHRAGRVLGVKASVGQLVGMVRPSESGRASYEISIWIKEDGLAYRCTCPVGVERKFCKHGVAVALAHVDAVAKESQARVTTLEHALASIDHDDLIATLVDAARDDERLRATLESLFS